MPQPPPQPSLFDEAGIAPGTARPDAPPHNTPNRTPNTPAPTTASRKQQRTTVQPAPPDAALLELAARLPPRLRMGTSSWHFPGWAGLVWGGD